MGLVLLRRLEIHGGETTAGRPRPDLQRNGWCASGKGRLCVSRPARADGGQEGPLKGERIAQAQDISLKFLENILIDLRHAGIVRAQRGGIAATGWPARRRRSRWAR